MQTLCQAYGAGLRWPKKNTRVQREMWRKILDERSKRTPYIPTITIDKDHVSDLPEWSEAERKLTKEELTCLNKQL